MTKSNSRELSRRRFLGMAAGVTLGATFLDRYHQLAAAEMNRVKIRDVQVSRSPSLVLAPDLRSSLPAILRINAAALHARCHHHFPLPQAIHRLL